ncbi:hypothetical protein [Sphingobium sp. SYK-6]|uniref:hypothetical protein n=1 Tax=Sphingobium sp. (strain NBRC 103272 / SYK-6) TaxID=627192 RepID=UPI001E2A8093|nr:hypothetical protein [Sphingobium sp. SYK-6]
MVDSGETLCGRNEFEPVSCGSEMHHAEEAIGQLVAAFEDGTVHLKVAEHSLDAIALFIWRLAFLDRNVAV